MHVAPAIQKASWKPFMAVSGRGGTFRQKNEITLAGFGDELTAIRNVIAGYVDHCDVSEYVDLDPVIDGYMKNIKEMAPERDERGYLFKMVSEINCTKSAGISMSFKVTFYTPSTAGAQAPTAEVIAIAMSY